MGNMNHKDQRKIFILGIGAMKAGTTWLYSYINSCDRIVCSPLKEIHYFDVVHRPDLFSGRVNKNWRDINNVVQGDKIGQHLDDWAVRSNLERLYMHYDERAYMNHFRMRETEVSSHYCEITPSYALLPQQGFQHVKDLMNSEDVKLKVVLLLRDPIERHWSQYRFDRRKSKRHEANCYLPTLRNPHWVERGLYHLTIERLLRVFSHDELYIEFYEELFKPRVVHKMLEFLEITDMGAPNFEEKVGATKHQENMPIDFIKNAYEVYSEVYAWCDRYFGDQLPTEWFENTVINR